MMLSFSVFNNRTGPGTLLEPSHTPITLDLQKRTMMALVMMKPCEKTLQITSKALLAPSRFDGEAKGNLISSPLKCISLINGHRTLDTRVHAKDTVNFTSASSIK